MPKAFSVSGDEENRTLDLLHAMQALYQLSYVPVRVFPQVKITRDPNRRSLIGEVKIALDLHVIG
jgi:hypothetical protein